MDENSKKNERELIKYRAKLRMDYYPLPLRWFKFFRYVSMILNIINCISGIISYILIAATINNPEAIEKIQAAFAKISGTSGINMELFTVIAVADFLVTVYLLVLCVLVFKRMGTLAVSGYNLIIAFLISVPVINGVRQLMSGCLNVMVYPEVYTFGDTIRNMIVMIAFRVSHHCLITFISESVRACLQTTPKLTILKSTTEAFSFSTMTNARSATQR